MGPMHLVVYVAMVGLLLFRRCTAGHPGRPMHGDVGSTTFGPLLLRVDEAAAMLGIGKTMMFELIASGQVASVRIGSARRIPVEAVHAYVDQLMAEASADDCSS